MKLTVDAGNSNIAIGLFDGNAIAYHWRLSSAAHWTADEFLLHLDSLLRVDDIRASDVSTAVVSCVVPGLLHPVSSGIEKLLGFEPVIVSVNLQLSVRVGTENPQELGSDLLANAVAGHRLAKGAAIVVDFGTALTFTAVDREGTIRGATIAPGVRTGLHGLVTRTAALPVVDLSPPADRYIGTNTTSAIRCGILNGYAGLVDHVVAGMVLELQAGGAPSVMVIATGGEASLVAPACTRVARIEPWLTLEGLAHIGELNQ
ncbi:MAG: type III pantothenate kinase [Spirochaetota bacterium]